MCIRDSVYAFLESSKKYFKIIEDEGGVDFLDTLYGMGEGYTLDMLKPHVYNICRCACRNEVNDVIIGLQDYISNAENYSIREIFDEDVYKRQVYFTHNVEFKLEKGQPVFIQNGYEKCANAWNRRIGNE